MSLGSRALKRGRAVLTASAGLSSTPREPFLFLYPQWTRGVVTVQEQLAVDGHNKQEKHAGGFFGEIAKLNAVDSHEAVVKLAREKASDADTEVFTLGPLPRIKSDETSNYKTEDHLIQATRLRAGDLQDTRQDDATSRKSPAGAVVRKVVAKAQRRAARKLYNAKVREEIQEWRRKERDVAPPDWRSILRDLEIHTPKQSTTWHDEALRILVPVNAVGKLAFGLDDSIWDIKARCGCHIKLAKEDGDGDHRAVLLSGPVTGIAKAAAEILQIVPGSITDEDFWLKYPPELNTQSQHTKRHQSSFTAGSVPVRSVRAEKRQQMAMPMRADKVARPTSWTVASFAAYVQHLTSIKMSSHVQGVLYERGESHADVVMEALRGLFLDAKYQDAISVSAFNDAIAYLVKHNNIKTVRELYVHMEDIDQRMNTTTFNIMLRGTAKSHDLHTFQFILGLMLGRGCAPNAHTWAAFLMALDSFQIKLHILEAMRSKELLNDPQSRKSVCEQLVTDEIQVALDNDIAQDEFLTHMASRYSRGWLTASTAHRILDALGSRGLISRCWDFIQFMHDQDIRPHAISVNTILYHCVQQSNSEGAIELIRRLLSLDSFRADEKTYQTLFNMAWDGHLYATARVVWRYACLDASTTFRMRKRVSDGLRLLLFNSQPASTPLEMGTAKKFSLWNATAGSFILGFPSLSSKQQQQPLLSGTCTQSHLSFPAHRLPVAASPQSPALTTEGKSKARTIETMVREALQRDLGISHDWTAQERFADLLVEAFRFDRDMGFREVGKFSGKDITDNLHLEGLLERAPRVPLKPRVGGAGNGMKTLVFW